MQKHIDDRDELRPDSSKMLRRGEEMVRLDIKAPINVKSRLRDRIAGQDKAVDSIAALYMKIKSGVDLHTGRPIDAIMLAGPSGVGKTKSVIALVDMFIEDDMEYSNSYQNQARNPESWILKIDCGYYQYGHEVAKLIGAPPGYLGHDKNNGLLSHININNTKITFRDMRGNSRSVLFLLVDEAEKAHQDLHNMLLGVLDRGRIALGDNSIVDLSNAVIFFTTNLGNAEIDRGSIGFSPHGRSQGREFGKAYQRHFPPEYRGRISKIVMYEHLARKDLNDIISMELRDMSRRLDMELSITDKAMDLLANGSNTRSEGARGVIKRMGTEIFDRLAVAAYGGDVRNGRYLVDANGSGKLGIYRAEGRNVRAFAAGASDSGI